jgi:hypothetical protein
MVSLSHRVLEAFGLALCLSSNFFKSMCQKAMVTMRLLPYSTQSIVVNQNQLGCRAHTRCEFFTLLCQSGLQILNNKGEWINTLPILNTFVVNIGDLVQRWTRHQLIIFQSIDRQMFALYRKLNRSSLRRRELELSIRVYKRSLFPGIIRDRHSIIDKQNYSKLDLCEKII